MTAPGAGPGAGRNLRADGRRLWDSLMAMAEIGATPAGGCNRQTLTDLDLEGRELFRSWCEAAGCAVTVDRMGNMRALRPGRRPDLPPVAIGSHLDTQPTGGKFDGVLGVLAGLEVVRTLNDLEVETDHPILLVNWTNEEGARFAPAMVASGVWAGAFDQTWAHARTDKEGKRLGDELARIGYLGDVPCAPERWKCHLELHIEQGPILEAEGKAIGVVTGGQGIRWYDVTVLGRESHAGSTPMPRRKDALVAAARAIARLDGIAREHAPAGVATVGVLDVHPASRNVIPGRARFSVDLRHPDVAALDAMESALRAAVAEACAAGGTEGEVERLWDFPPVAFDAGCVAAVRAAAEAFGYPHRDIVTGPGHDSCYTARVVPTSMVFVPCKDGLSHNEAESIEPEHAEAGCNVLLRAAVEMARAG